MFYFILSFLHGLLRTIYMVFFIAYLHGEIATEREEFTWEMDEDILDDEIDRRLDE